MLWEIDKHYLKKENQLFPRLEEKGMSGPSQVMWAFHDDIRQIIKDFLRQSSEMDPNVIFSSKNLIQKIRDMIYKEENILYPMSLDTFTVHDWLAVKDGEEEIGYAWIQPFTEWTPELREETIDRSRRAQRDLKSTETTPMLSMRFGTAR